MEPNKVDFLTYPGQMDVTTMVGCGVGCAYCPQGSTLAKFRSKGEKNRVLTLDNFLFFLSKIPKTIQINFAGYTEPFLNPACVDMVVESVTRGYRTTIFTTLRGLSIDDLERMSCLNFESVEIHLPTTTGRQKVGFGKEYLEKLVFAQRKLKNANFVMIDWLNPAETHSEILHVLDEERIFHEPANSRAGNISSKIVQEPKKHIGAIQCDRGLNSNVLLPNGDVSICCQDFGLQHVIGNLFANSYEQLFSSKEYKTVSEGLKSEESGTLCRFCEYAIKTN